MLLNAIHTCKHNNKTFYTFDMSKCVCLCAWLPIETNWLTKCDTDHKHKYTNTPHTHTHSTMSQRIIVSFRQFFSHNSSIAIFDISLTIVNNCTFHAFRNQKRCLNHSQKNTSECSTCFLSKIAVENHNHVAIECFTVLNILIFYVCVCHKFWRSLTC